MKLKVRWQNGAERGSREIGEASVDVSKVDTEGGMVIFLDHNRRPVLVIPDNRILDAVEDTNA